MPRNLRGVLDRWDSLRPYQKAVILLKLEWFTNRLFRLAIKLILAVVYAACWVIELGRVEIFIAAVACGLIAYLQYKENIYCIA